MRSQFSVLDAHFAVSARRPGTVDSRVIVRSLHIRFGEMVMNEVLWWSDVLDQWDHAVRRTVSGQRRLPSGGHDGPPRV